MPRIVDLGGPVLQSPNIVPVFFADDDPNTVSQMGDFVSKVPRSPWWTTVVGEYQVSQATVTPPVQLASSDNPATQIDDSQIAAWLAAKLDANDAALPPADANTVYLLFYPPGVTVTATTFGQTSQSCSAPNNGSWFAGYHSSTTLDSAHQQQRVVYVVVPRCAGPIFSMTGSQLLTFSASHEMVEAVTDPFPTLAQPEFTYITWDADHAYWESFEGVELADACQNLPAAQSSGYSVPRIWSNAASVAGVDPCVPAPDGEAYFNSVPELNDDIAFNQQGVAAVKGAHIPVGASATVTLDLFSSAPTQGPWTVSAADFAGGAQLQFSFDKTSGQNGDKLQMTIHVLSSGQGGSEYFTVTSRLGSQTQTWYGIVGN